MALSKRELFAKHKEQITLWLSSSEFKLWIRPTKKKEYTEVKTIESLLAQISDGCDLVCYETQPKTAYIGDGGTVIAPITKDTVLGKSIVFVYTPKLPTKEIWDQNAFFTQVCVNPGDPVYAHLLENGLLFLRYKDAMKVAKVMHKKLK
jgi:hypothetical protein